MGMMKLLKRLSGYRRVAVLVSVIALIVALCTLAAPAAGQTEHNYAEALQKSLYFYDAEKSGPGITGGRLEWRGDSDLSDMAVPLRPVGDDGLGTNMSQSFIDANRAVLDPDGNGTMDLSGGMHDAGDHVKFGLPQSYSFSTLGWSYYHFKDAYQNVGEDQHMLEILKWFSDYYLRATFRNSSGDIVAFAYQVGEGSVDHTLWAPPELHNLPRPAYFSTSETPATDQAAAAAAALSIMYLNYRDIDASYADTCLDVAKALYRHAKQYHSDTDPKLGYSGGFYNSSFDHDELSWAAVWLYRATGDQAYIDDIVAVDSTGHYTGWLKKIVASTQDNWQNIWVHSWDTVWGGVFLELAPITDDPKHWYYARWNLEYWSGIAHEDPSDGTFLVGTPAGFKVISTWGSARYNAAAQLQAMVYRKYTGRTDFTDWAKTQMDYILGDNPFGYSLEVGYPSPELSAKHPHHRAAHGSVTNSMEDPPEHRHVLWGALVGGPDYDDVHKDLTTDFVYNEVAIDYNAGFVGALVGMYEYYGAGQQPVANFPPLEPAETAYFDQAMVAADQDDTQRTQFTLRLNVIPTHPPHLVTGLKARYFFNISELSAYGQTISDVHTELNYDEQASNYGGATIVTGPVAWDAANGIYYVEMDWSDYAIYGKRDIQLSLVVGMASDYGFHWDPSNDWSYQGLGTTLMDTLRIPVYLNGELVYGQEPGPIQPTIVPPTATPVTVVPSTPTPVTVVPPTATPVTVIPPTSTSVPTGAYQAEDATLGGGVSVETNHSGYYGTGFVNFPSSGGYVEYRNVDGGAGGSRTLRFRHALGASSSRTGQLTVNGASRNITFSPTGSWDTWSIHEVVVNLNAGTTNTIRLQSTGQDLANQDQMEVVGGTVPTATPVTVIPPTSTPVTVVPPTSTPVTIVPPTSTPVTVVPPTSTPVQGTCSVNYAVQNDWGSGATVSVTIQNNGTSAINGWVLTWTFPGNQQIINLWNGSYTQSGASVSVSNAGWNGTIGANGGTVGFGFNLTYSGTNAAPTSFSLNGTICQ